MELDGGGAPGPAGTRLEGAGPGPATPEGAGPGPAVLEPAVPETGDLRVDQALARLADLRGLPVEEHPAVFEQVHGGLTAALGALDSGGDDVPGPSGTGGIPGAPVTPGH
jgi:hypothetical protein